MKNLLISLFILLSLPCVAQQSRSDSIALSDKLYSEGVGFYHDKKYDKAAKTFEQLRPIDEQLYDSLDQRHFYASDWLASCYGKMGRTAEAIELSNDFELPPVEKWGREVIDSLSYLAMQRFSLPRKKSCASVTIWAPSRRRQSGRTTHERSTSIRTFCGRIMPT